MSLNSQKKFGSARIVKRGNRLANADTQKLTYLTAALHAGLLSHRAVKLVDKSSGI
jgi:hypothetical protein